MLGVKDKKIKRVGVLRGGAGKHYTSSLSKGGEIISHIFEKLSHSYKPVDILIDKNHIWHCGGVPINPGDLINKIDIAWNVAHPSMSNILDSLSIPHISTPAFSSTLENSKELLREHMRKIGLQMPRSVILPVYQVDFDARPTEPRQTNSVGLESFGRGPIQKYAIKKAKEVFEKFSSPWIVKSFTEDSNTRPTEPRQTNSVGLESFGRVAIHLAKTFPELINAIEDGAKHEKSILVEEFIAGKVASVHSVPKYRGENIYTFPARNATHNVAGGPLGNSFGNFSTGEKEILSHIAKDLHKHIGAKHYLKSDFVLNSNGRVYLLQIESMPDLKTDSHFSQVCESVGAKMHHVVEHILKQA